MAKGKKKGKDLSQAADSSQAASSATTEPETPDPVESIVQPAAALSLADPPPGPSAKVEGQEEDGLGLGPAKRKRPPKKRKGAAAAEPPPDAAQPSAQPQPDVAQQAPGYAQQQPGFAQQAPGFAQQQPGFAQQAPGFAQQQPGFAQQQPGLAQQAPGFAQQQPYFGQGPRPSTRPPFSGHGRGRGMPPQDPAGHFPGGAMPGQPQPQATPGAPRGPWPGHGQPQSYPGQIPQGPMPGQAQPQATPGAPRGPWPGHGQPQSYPGQIPQGPKPGQAQPQATPGAPRGPWPGHGQPQSYPGQIPQGPMPGQGPAQIAPGQRPAHSAPTQGPQGPMPGQGPPHSAPTQRPPGPMPGQGPPQSTPGQRPQGPMPGPGQQGQRAAPGPAPAGQLSRLEIPKKIIDPARTVPGRIVRLLTNYLQMNIQPIKVHRYDVAITPDRPKKAIPHVFKTVMQKNFPKFVVAFDQMKNFYSADPLPKITATDKFTTRVDLTDPNGKVMKFEVAIQATGVVDFKTLIAYMQGGTSLKAPVEAIQCVDVVLRQGTLETYIKAGRQFFKRPANPVPLGDGLEMWTGLFQSAIFTSRPFVNVDVAHKGFPIQQSMLALLDSFKIDPTRNIEQQRGRGIENFMDLIKGLRVVASIGGGKERREYICNGLAKPATEQRFTSTDDAGRTKTITVGEYFEREKKIRLKYPHLNCMHVGPRDKDIYYPLELLEVSYGQVRNKQLNDMQLSKMVREAATPPDQRLQKIKDIIKDMQYPVNPIFHKFGLKISDQFTPVQGKIMEPPQMKVGGVTVKPGKGMWQGNRLLQGAAMDRWGVIAVELSQGESNAGKLIELVKSEGQRMGLRTGDPTLVQFGVRLQELQRVLSAARDQKLQLLVAIVNSRRRDCYTQVKKVAERSVGVLTQCIKDQTVQYKLNAPTVHNILLKVNSKLMGVNHALEASAVPACMRAGDVMVVGADVTHSTPDQQSIPSIAAVTASIDAQCTQYNLEFSIQTPKKEMIVQFEDIMLEHLHVYQRRNKRLPRRVYVFRDGVSEGQFAEVMSTELQAIYAAYARLDNKTRPEVLFAVVQKRHHTRFFNEKAPRFNAEPGTVVDTLIVHPTELDFYLVSHQAIKGTARPTRYHVLRNDGNLSQDEVEQLAFYLCHLYSRCSRSVSYPAPTYYAHLACLRARTLTMNETFDNSKLETEPQRLRIKPEVHQCNPMYFV